MLTIFCEGVGIERRSPKHLQLQPIHLLANYLTFLWQ